MTNAQAAAGGTAVTEEARAKVNLTLQVTGRRADGYHELESLVVFAGVGDSLRVEPCADRAFTLAVEGLFADKLSHEPDNLVLRAARALSARAGSPSGAAMTLTKNLPVASGIGGGSADAAAALRGLARLWDLKVPEDTLRDLALGLGADVPVCLRGEAVLMSGIGEKLQPVAALPPLWLLLVNPGVAVSTPAVFKAREGAFSAVAEPRLPPPDLRGFVQWLEGRRNDLEAPACRLAPAVGNVLAALRRQPDCLLARMSGSGATCFALFGEEAAAREAATAIAAQQPGWWVAPAPLCA